VISTITTTDYHGDRIFVVDQAASTQPGPGEAAIRAA